MTPYQDAKQLYNNGNYVDALTAIESAINSSKTYNEYHYYLYGNILRKLGQPDKFIEIMQDLFDKEIFKEEDFYNNISWCIYDLYVKDYNDDSTYDLYEKSKYIIDHCTQLDNITINPLVLTIFKNIKFLSIKSSVNYKLIIELLEKLDYAKLPNDDTFSFIDDRDIERELASKRERYFQTLTKAYEKVGNYKKCIDLCQIALNDNIKWHNKGNMWILSRLQYSKCKMDEDYENSVNEYEKLAIKNRFWYMYHKLSNIYWSHNDINKALVYACMAFDINSEIEKKVNVMFDLGCLFEGCFKRDIASKFFHACYYYRNLNGWFIDSDLKYKVKFYDIDCSINPDIQYLKLITVEYLNNNTSNLYGKIINISRDKGFGFISPIASKNNIYFKTKEIMNRSKYLPINSFVQYEIITKNDKTSAIKIMLI